MMVEREMLDRDEVLDRVMRQLKYYERKMERAETVEAATLWRAKLVAMHIVHMELMRMQPRTMLEGAPG